MTAKPALLLTFVIACAIALGTLSPAGKGEPMWPGDKELHAMAWALLVFPLGWVRPRLWPGIAMAGLGYGGLIEVLQTFVDRSAEWGDLLADGIGVVLGLLPGQVRRWMQR